MHTCAVLDAAVIFMSTNPFTPPASSENSSRASSRERRSWLVFFVGLASVVVFAYLMCVHVTLISFAARGSVHQMDAVVSYPPVMAIHVFVCTVGVATAIGLLVHALRNRRIRLGRRILWGMAIAAGYGMMFYWHRHVRSTTLE